MILRHVIKSVNGIFVVSYTFCLLLTNMINLEEFGDKWLNFDMLRHLHISA